MDSKEMLLRTKSFSYRCIDLCNDLKGDFLKIHIRGQLIRCSTSLAANYRAARLSQSTATFIAKLSICIEESDESQFWLELIKDKNLLPPIAGEELNTLITESGELTAILITTRKTMKLKSR